MGGGDLNLKKSWHPSTLRNIERVWKAEQKHEVEQQKIEQLQKELAAERAREEMQTYAEDQGVVRKKEQRLDWMYQGPAAFVDREDYLLGRKIDKTLELVQMQESGKEAEKREEDQARSVFHPSASSSDITVDLANKIKEDPLFAIMKREKEERKTLLNNPVRMKQLRTMLKDALSNKKKSKKSKKKSKKAKYSSGESSNDSDSDSNANFHTMHKQNDKRKNIADKYEDRSSRRKHKKHKHDTIKERENERYSQKLKDYKESHRYQDDQDRYYSSKERRNNNYSKHKENQVCRREESSRSYEVKRESETKRKLTSEDKQKLLKEMMDNAKWRESQRKNNVKRYKEENDREEKVPGRSASDFIKPMLSKAAEYGSVENRVKQKIFTIQRKTSDMDSHFARR